MTTGAAAASPHAVPAGVASPTAAEAAARAAGFAGYGDYLRSAAWRGGPARLAALRIAAGHCRICNAGRGIRLEVHHRCYERLGAERPGDLIAVCPDCHDGVTDMIRRRARAAVPLAVVAGGAPVTSERGGSSASAGTP